MGANRLERESYTIEQMVKIFCGSNHNSNNSLCVECSLLLKYANDRIQNCKFGFTKPTCKRCRIHCYKKDLGEKMREIMRYAGPKMLFFHPILTAMHILDAAKSTRN